jgi:OMF family outer membrane factor
VLPSIQGKGNFESRRDVATSKFTDPTEKESYLASLELTQPIYSGGALMAGIQFGKRGVEYAVQTKLASKQKTARKIIERYLSVSELKQLLEAANNHLVRLKKYAETTGRYAKIGRSREIDNLQSQVNVELSDQDTQALKKQLADSSLQLAAELQTQIEPQDIQTLPEEIKKVSLPQLKFREGKFFFQSFKTLPSVCN